MAWKAKEPRSVYLLDDRMIDTEPLLRAMAALKRSEAYERQGDVKNANTAAVEASIWLGKWVDQLSLYQNGK